jgi:ADP-heptose:LPS heptosyltransferase
MDKVVHVVLRRAWGMRQRQHEKTVLLIRTDGIGDFVYSVRYLDSICQRYQGYKIVLCCRNETAELARSMIFIDQVVGFDSLRCRRNYWYRYRVLMKIRSIRPSVAVYLSFHRENIGDEMTLFSGAAQTFAFSGNDECIHPSLRVSNNREYSDQVDVADHIPERDKYALMMKRLDCPADGVGTNVGLESYLRTPEAIPQEFQRAIGGSKFVLIGPGGSGLIRRWPAAQFALIADMIASEFGLTIVLCGDRSEQDLLLDISRAMKKPVELCSDRRLSEVAAIMKKATAFVGNESGLLHMAASLSVPAIGILGGGHFHRYFPYGSVRVVHHQMDCYECNWSCKFPQPYCLTDISVNDVMNEFRKLSLRQP